MTKAGVANMQAAYAAGAASFFWLLQFVPRARTDGRGLKRVIVDFAQYDT